MIEQLMKVTASYIHSHHNIGVLIAAFISFLESLAIVGSIIPGSVTMTIVGSLIGSGVLSAKITIFAIFIGGMIGDYVSFWCGYYYKEDIKNFKITKRYEKFFIWGEDFIKKQGMKSIVIGRFFGPMRSMIPMVAGILSMPRGKFILAAIPSVILWAICYLTPGILLGAFAIELPPNAAFKFIILVLSSCILLALFLWLINRACKTVSMLQQSAAMTVWKKITEREKSTLHKYISNSNGYLQIIKLVYIFIMLALVTGILLYLHHHNNILNIDIPIKNLMTNLYNPIIYKIMLAIGYLGDKLVIFPTIGIMLIFLTLKEQYKLRLYLFSITITASATIGMTKYLFGRLRPTPEAAVLLENFSFPSGHILLSTALLCFIIAIICASKKYNERIAYYQLTAVFLLVLAFARVYVGAHWVSDVLVSAIIGFIIGSIFSFLYYRKHSKEQILPTIKVGIIAYGIIWLCYSAIFLEHDASKYVSPSFESYKLTNSKWHKNQNIDLVRNNIFGMPMQPFNLQWLGNKDSIEQILHTYSWKKHKVEPEFFNRLIKMLSEPKLSIKPLFSQKYHHKPAVMIFSYPLKTGKEIILKLWESEVTVEGKDLWLGSIYIDNLHPRIFKAEKDYSSFNVIPKIQQILTDNNLGIHIISALPKDNNFNKWDHKIMQINFVNHSSGENND